MNPLEIRDYFQSRQSEMIDAIREIVNIESPSRDAERNLKVVAWIEEKLRGLPLDLEIENISADGLGEHLLIRAFPGEAKGTLILGHTDTVHPVETCRQNPTRIEDGKLYGCGVFDMKANIILMLESLRLMAEMNLQPAAPITILLSCDEEIGSKTGREFVEREAGKSAQCYVFEPSAGGKVKTGRKGTGMYTLSAHGIPAHAGLEPEKGANAVLEIARQIEKISSLNAPDIGTTVNVTIVRGGTTSNVIPENAECEVDVRFTSIKEAERIAVEMSSLKNFDPRVTLEVRGGMNRPPMERTDAVVGLYAQAREAAAAFGYELGETQVGGASDGNFVGALGVPVLDGLGIAGNGAHTLDEYIYIDDIVPRAALVTTLLLK